MIAVRRVPSPDDHPRVTLPCGHVVIVKPSWLDADGRFVGRLGCPECRRVYDNVVLPEI